LKRKEYYVPLEYLKDISLRKYPFYNVGSMRLSVSGEYLSLFKKNNQPVVYARTIYLKYVNDLTDVADTIDYILLKEGRSKDTQSGWDHTVQMEAQPALSNHLFTLDGLLRLIIPPLQIFLIAMILSVRSTSYILEKDRVLVWSGIFYRSRKSILYKKIDHFNRQQGAMNKFFGNGTIDIHTEGSGQIEMRISNISEWQEFYNKLSELYDSSLR
jgi:membrane protein YdbS with pleckstrin-like domain